MELYEAFNFNLPSFSLIIEVTSLLENLSIIQRDYILNKECNVKREKWMDQIKKG